MINPTISADWNTTKPIAAFILYTTCTRRTYQSWGRTPYPWSPRLRGIIQLSRIGKVLRNIWLTLESLQIGVRPSRLQHSSCTPRLQEVHTKAEVVHLTPGLLGLGVLCTMSRIGNVLRNIWLIHRISAVWSTTKQIAPFSCTARVQEVHIKAEVVHLTLGLLGLGELFNCHA